MTCTTLIFQPPPPPCMYPVEVRWKWYTADALNNWDDLEYSREVCDVEDLV